MRRRARPKARSSAPNVAHATPTSHYSRRSERFGWWVIYLTACVLTKQLGTKHAQTWRYCNTHWRAMPCSQHATSPAKFSEIGYNLVVSSACCNDPRSSSGFRQRANAVLIATRRLLSRVLKRVHHWPLTTTTNDERYKTGANRARIYMGARNMPSLRWADTGPVAWRPPRCRGVVVWRCTPPGGRRTVLSE